jgi:hypothetical protein
MRNFHTVVLERLKHFTSDFETEPYETGWASEAIFFLRLHEVTGEQVALDSFIQVSVDGINWIDEGTRFPPLYEVGDYFVRVSHFGGWLRLRNTLRGDNPELKLTINLVLKA